MHMQPAPSLTKGLNTHAHACMHVCTYVRTHAHGDSVQLTAINYNNRHHQSINSNDTGHDNRDDRLHNEVRPHHSHSGDTHATLGSAVCCTNRYQGVEVGGEERNQSTEHCLLCMRLWLSLTRTFNALFARVRTTTRCTVH